MKNNKSIKKPIRDKVKSLIVKKVAEKFVVDTATVYNAVRGDSKSELADELRADFARLEKQVKEALK